jgi:hypothetical protein
LLVCGFLVKRIVCISLLLLGRDLIKLQKWYYDVLNHLG